MHECKFDFYSKCFANNQEGRCTQGEGKECFSKIFWMGPWFCKQFQVRGLHHFCFYFFTICLKIKWGRGGGGYTLLPHVCINDHGGHITLTRHESCICILWWNPQKWVSDVDCISSEVNQNALADECAWPTINEQVMISKQKIERTIIVQWIRHHAE